MSQTGDTILVTGGAGFIGCAVVRQLVHDAGQNVVTLDALTYAANLDSLAEVIDHPNHVFVHGDVRDRELLDRIFHEFQPVAVLHLAAETHVDRSIEGSSTFVETNMVGTHVLLEATRAYWQILNAARKKAFRFHHISTDEVYGDIGPDTPPVSEEAAYAPSSPYAASKAASDHLVRAWHRTYGLPVLVSNCSNNYGPRQFPEKLIPLMILRAQHGKSLPIYGQGDNVRDWLYVEDHARALQHILRCGRPGRTYNVGGRSERTNIDVVNTICAHLDKLVPKTSGSYKDQITFVSDRPGHDKRYAIDDRRLEDELNWRPETRFEDGLLYTVQWYLDNPDWIERGATSEYRAWIQQNYDKRAE